MDLGVVTDISTSLVQETAPKKRCRVQYWSALMLDILQAKDIEQ